MKNMLLWGIVILLILAGVLGFNRRLSLRRFARAILSVFSLLLGGLTVFMIFMGLKTMSSGGFVLLLFALFPGFITMICLNFLLSSAAQESYFHKTTDEKIQFNLEEMDKIERDFRNTLAKNTEERERFWISSKRRRQLDSEIAHAKFMLTNLQKMRVNIKNKDIYAKDEP